MSFVFEVGWQIYSIFQEVYHMCMPKFSSVGFEKVNICGIHSARGCTNLEINAIPVILCNAFWLQKLSPILLFSQIKQFQFEYSPLIWKKTKYIFYFSWSLSNVHPGKHSLNSGVKRSSTVFPSSQCSHLHNFDNHSLECLQFQGQCHHSALRALSSNSFSCSCLQISIYSLNLPHLRCSLSAFPTFYAILFLAL